MTDDFMEEIKEDVRNDQLLALWNEYGNIIIGAIIAIIIATAGYLFWHNHQEQKQLEQTLVYEQNLESKTPDFKNVINGGSTGYKIMGTLKQAKAASNTQESEALLKSLANDTDLNAFYRQSAALMAIMKKFDSTNGKVLLEELQNLLSKDSAILPAALELQAFAYLKLENTQAASQAFLAVAKNQKAPQSMQIRARAMLEMLN